MIIALALLAAAQDAGGFFNKYCIDCHDADKPKKDLRLDVLPKHRDVWANVYDRLRFGEMPPPKSSQPTAAEKKAALAAIAPRAEEGREGRTVLRRLNRVEYQNTMRDLLGVDLDLKSLLPPDASAHGFDNVGEALHTSSFLMERYLDAAEAALAAALGEGPRVWVQKKRLDPRSERPAGDVYRKLDDALAIFASQENANIQVTFWGFRTFFPGRYRIRIGAYAVQSDGRPVTFHLKEGSTLDVAHNRLIGYYDVPPTPTVIEIEERLESPRTLRLAVDGLVRPREIQKVGVQNWKGPGLAVQWIDVEGPLPHATRPVGELRDFARRAFRREVTDAELEPYLAREKASGLRAALKAMLISPDFLFLREPKGELDDFALASRLSYFLWSSMPDDELLARAGKGELRASMPAQIERMLKDPKAAAFTENFVGQWLNLRAIDDTEPDPTLYPEYDDDLKVSMLREPFLYWDELLRGDLPLTRLIGSDFSLLNNALARLYGIAGIEGREFRKVTLPAGSRRGGVLTMAAVLKVTANGTNTSPVLRGTYVLERILGTPPPRPPMDVEAVEPDIRGATTIREQLAKHRDRPECAGCHRRIDPPGFALESFDVIGGWRDFYRSVGKGEWVKGTSYRKGPAVDPSDALADGRRFRDVDEYKALLLKDPDGLARSLAEKLLTYATGAAPSRLDADAVDAVVASIRPKGYGLRALVHAVAASPLFRRK